VADEQAGSAGDEDAEELGKGSGLFKAVTGFEFPAKKGDMLWPPFKLPPLLVPNNPAPLSC